MTRYKISSTVSAAARANDVIAHTVRTAMRRMAGFVEHLAFAAG
jgi:hypothetical protein